MAKTAYIAKNFKPESLATIERANAIIDEYMGKGFDLTLRQLYYQFVARGHIENTERSYKNLGSLIDDGRLAGLIDWSAIVDRTRYLRSNGHWESPHEIVAACAGGYQIDKWKEQRYRPEVWIEKDALIGVIAEVCDDLDVGYFSCRGYVSQSEMHGAAMRLRRYARLNGQTPLIIHLGDHDPSGVDMTRDIFDRMKLFMGGLEVKRIALTMDQVQEHNPPPNPAKISDSRAEGYIREYGDESWELDALDPQALSDLVRNTIYEYRDADAWDVALQVEKAHRSKIEDAAAKMEDDL